MRPQINITTANIVRDNEGNIIFKQQVAPIFQPKKMNILLDPATANGTVGIVRNAGLGDILMITPAIKALKKRRPDLEIDYWVPPYHIGLLDHNPYCNGKALSEGMALPPDNVCDEYDHFCILNNYVEMHQLNFTIPRPDLFAMALGVTIEDTTPLYYIEESERDWALGWLLSQGLDPNKKTVGICGRGIWFWRSWPIRHIKTATLMLVDDYNVVITDHNNQFDIGVPGPIYACGFPLRQIAAIMSHFDVMVSPDSGMYHLAAALGVDMVVLFSAIKPDLRVSKYHNFTAIAAGLPCQPCNSDDGRLMATCGAKCITELDPSLVVAEIKRRLEGKAQVKEYVTQGMQLPGFVASGEKFRVVG